MSPWPFGPRRPSQPFYWRYRLHGTGQVHGHPGDDETNDLDISVDRSSFEQANDPERAYRVKVEGLEALLKFVPRSSL